MCVRELAPWLVYLLITQGWKPTNRNTFSHVDTHAARTVTVNVFAYEQPDRV